MKRGEILVSFDVKALFPGVPVDRALQYLEAYLRRGASDKDLEICRTNAEVCIKQNFFFFRGKVYEQVFGLSMGSKISPYLANIYMCGLEEELKSHQLFPRIWWRYVDDVFAVIKARFKRKILEWLNSQAPTIEFTIEEEKDGTLPFLDLKIHRKEDDSIIFLIYRKPTNTDRYIMESSFHHRTHKAAAFNSMIYRTLNIPLEEKERKEELDKIYQIAAVNGYIRTSLSATCTDDT